MWDDNLRFLRKISSVLFALLVMLLTCLFHFRSLGIVIPRYLAESVIGNFVPDRERERERERER